MTTPKKTPAEWLRVLDEAHAAASAAQAGLVEDPRALDCGFAWVTIPGTHPLARACRRSLADASAAALAAGRRGAARDRRLGDRGYPRGWQFWKPGGFAGQAVGIHERGALAFAARLEAEGVPARVGSRLD